MTPGAVYNLNGHIKRQGRQPEHIHREQFTHKMADKQLQTLLTNDTQMMAPHILPIAPINTSPTPMFTILTHNNTYMAH